MAAQVGGKDLFQTPDALVLVHRGEAQTLPGFWRAFNNAGASFIAERVGMKPDPARGRLFESEGKRVVHLARAEPDIFVPSYLDVGPKMFSVKLPSLADGTVGRDDQ